MDTFNDAIESIDTATNGKECLDILSDKGINWDSLGSIEGTLKLIDSKERIKHCFKDALIHYDDRLKYIGPDCGLSGWKPPEVAYELLKRTKDVIMQFRSEMTKEIIH